MAKISLESENLSGYFYGISRLTKYNISSCEPKLDERRSLCIPLVSKVHRKHFASKCEGELQSKVVFHRLQVLMLTAEQPVTLGLGDYF